MKRRRENRWSLLRRIDRLELLLARIYRDCGRFLGVMPARALRRSVIRTAEARKRVVSAN